MKSLRFAAVAAFAVTSLISSAPVVRAADRAPAAACCAMPCCATPCCAVPGLRPATATARRDYPVTVGKRTVLASSLAATAPAAAFCCAAACCGAGCCPAPSAGCCPAAKK